jgi:hypothetical protein
MSESYHLKTLSKQDDTVELDVTIVHPDFDEFPETKNFALQLLVDAGDRKGVLNEEISMDQRLDEKWLQQNGHRFIKSVKILSKKNHPRGGLGELRDDAGGEELEPEPDPQAVYSIQVVNLAYLAKIKPGLEWDTAAYDVGRDAPPK